MPWWQHDKHCLGFFYYFGCLYVVTARFMLPLCFFYFLIFFPIFQVFKITLTSKTKHWTETKIGRWWHLPGSNWGKISAKSIKGFWREEHIYNRRLDKSAAMDQHSPSQSYSAGWPHVGLCPKFLILLFVECRACFMVWRCSSTVLTTWEWLAPRLASEEKHSSFRSACHILCLSQVRGSTALC